jgi:hypothetical protein
MEICNNINEIKKHFQLTELSFEWWQKLLANTLQTY